MAMQPVWIEIQAEGKGVYWAQFAAKVLLRPFDQLAKFRWGWSSGSLLEEGLDRQILFLEAQQAPESYPGVALEPVARRLAMRYIHAPERAELKIVLMGKVAAESVESARQGALDYWEEIAATFPYDYVLRPALSQADFQSACRLDLVSALCGNDDAIEIRRYGNELRGKTQAIFFPGQWRWTAMANEQVWRALSGCSKPVILQVTLQSVALREEERCWMLTQGESAAALAHNENEDALTRQYAEYAVRIYLDQAKNYRNLYLEHVLLASPGGVPKYLSRAIGTAYTHREDRPVPLPGYQTFPAGAMGQAYLAGNVMPWGPGGESSGYNRILYLMGAQEANVAMRLPYPSVGGLPGVAFEHEE